MKAVKALTRPHGCAGSSEPSLVNNVKIITKFSCTGSNTVFNLISIQSCSRVITDYFNYGLTVFKITFGEVYHQIYSQKFSFTVTSERGHKDDFRPSSKEFF